MQEAPKILLVELPADRLITPFAGVISPALMQQYMQTCYVGAVFANGTWEQEAAAGWTVAKTGVGVYTVTHQLGYSNLSLSVSADNAMIAVISHSPTAFSVQLSKNGSSADMDWVFTVARVISP